MCHFDWEMVRVISLLISAIAHLIRAIWPKGIR